jgi:hypothetical protein
MPIGRIEKIVRSLVVQRAERNEQGFYVVMRSAQTSQLSNFQL